MENDPTGSKRLIVAGFLNKKGEERFGSLTQYERLKEVKTLKEDPDQYASNHEIDKTSDQYVKTGYPTPVSWFHLVHETFSKPLESFYFWSINTLSDMNYSKLHKISDIFAASEQSAMFGVSAQRLGIQQDKVAQFLATIGKLVKDLFQIVRELRIIDERLTYYNDTTSDNQKLRNAAEIALKGMYVDLVEGGTKNAGSVYGMARELQFTALPDLFFSINPSTREDITPMIEKLEFNRKLKEVVSRKLYQYIAWKEATHKELKTRRSHTIKYLRQHYDSIQLYLTWVKPYLKHIKRLTLDQKRLESPDMVSAFEGATIEIEVLGTQIPVKHKHYYNCLLLTFFYRTSPTLPFQQDFQRGPLHMGRIEIMWRAYAWTQEDINAFIKMKQEEDFELLSTINESIQAAMQELGGDLRTYLEQAGEKFPEYIEKKETPPKEPQVSVSGILEPFTAPFKGIYDLIKPLVMQDDKTRKEKKEKEEKIIEQPAAAGAATALCWAHYKTFKKANRFITW